MKKNWLTYNDPQFLEGRQPKEFIELMQYTNTAKTLQRIGAGGYAK